ncbi:hypothetical protein HAX54_016565 [Datura stramonium]|uniref:Uncharacterized protein n=1 Tax=Datura stramonium TaxID=4076 RepID=A0ABS8UJ23_DATST|nr:hypothetical protein [Datura stramonium]
MDEDDPMLNAGVRCRHDILLQMQTSWSDHNPRRRFWSYPRCKMQYDDLKEEEIQLDEIESLQNQYENLNINSVDLEDSKEKGDAKEKGGLKEKNVFCWQFQFGIVMEQHLDIVRKLQFGLEMKLTFDIVLLLYFGNSILMLFEYPKSWRTQALDSEVGMPLSIINTSIICLEENSAAIEGLVDVEGIVSEEEYENQLPIS